VPACKIYANPRENKNVSETNELPAVHLSIDQLEAVESLLRENTTKCEMEIVLSLPGGVDQKFHSVEQIDSSVLADAAGSNSYTLTVTGEEGRCTIAGESTGTESHMLYCIGEADWRDKIKRETKEYFNSVQTAESRLRGKIAGVRATGAAVLAALFVGWAATAVAPQSVVNYYPTLLDAIVFSIGVFGLLIVRFRNWVHPYIWIEHDRSFSTKLRIGALGIATILITFAILTVRYLIEPGPFLR